MKHRTTSAVLLVLLAAVLSAQPESRELPNLVVIVADDLGYGAVPEFLVPVFDDVDQRSVRSIGRISIFQHENAHRPRHRT